MINRQAHAMCPCRHHTGSGRTQFRPFASSSQSKRAAAAPRPSARPTTAGAGTAPQDSSSLLQCAASVAAALALGLGAAAGVAHAVTTEQLLFLDAWRAVDRAYVDKNFNGQAWFRVREQYTKKESFNNRHETYAAIKKLLATLDDPFTRFLEPEKLSALRRGTQGGAGVQPGSQGARGSAPGCACCSVALQHPAGRAPAWMSAATLVLASRATQ
jgi:hypothetical protein